jgi:peptidoglycan/LPS O-acetylase OafA/YrhL
MPELDTLRGIAVSLVVCFHSFGFLYGINGLSGIPKVLVALTLPVWVGVNLFFVLSGFLITGILLDTKSRADYYRQFYVRRALRILPLYYAVLLLLLVLARSGLVERHVSWSFLALSSVYLANVTTLFGVPMQYGVLWSLAVEEHFYLLWPAVVCRLSGRNVIVCASVIAALCLWSIAYSVIGWKVTRGLLPTVSRWEQYWPPLPDVLSKPADACGALRFWHLRPASHSSRSELLSAYSWRGTSWV